MIEAYHLAIKDLGKEIYLIPHSYYDGEKPKVCFAPTISKCLNALPDIELEEHPEIDVSKPMIYYVYAYNDSNKLHPQTEEEDYNETKEIATYTKTKARRVGSISFSYGKIKWLSKG